MIIKLINECKLNRVKKINLSKKKGIKQKKNESLHQKKKIITEKKEIKIINKELFNKESIIIVGNGPSVLKNTYGDIIDSFDNVVRINHYQPSKNVGEKITHFICSPWKQKYNSKISDVAKEILIWNLIKANEPIVYSNLNKTKFINVKKINDILVNNFNFGNFPKNPLPSTGIVTILYFILLNKFKNIYIHGFDGLKPNKKLHYFDNRINDEKVHSSKLEINFINYFIDQGKIIKLKDSEIIKNIKVDKKKKKKKEEKKNLQKEKII